MRDPTSSEEGIHILLLELGGDVLEDGSDTRRRHEAYAEYLSQNDPGSEISIVCHSAREDIVEMTDSLTVCPSGTNSRLGLPFSMLREGYAVAKRRDIDLIVPQTPFDDCVAGLVLGGLFDANVLASHHCPLFDDPAWGESVRFPRFKSRLAEYTVPHVDAIRVVSRAALDWYQARGVPRERLYCNPVSSTFPDTGGDVALPDGPKVLTVGRVIERKGIGLLVDAFSEVVEAEPTAHLHVVGSRDESYVARLEDRLHQRETDGRVTWHGYVPERDLAAYYRAADVFVSPSRVEPYGRVMVEALWFGTPVVATNTVGARDIVGEEWGKILRDRDPSTMADAILDVVTDRETGRQMGRRGQAYVRSEHDPESFRRDWIDIWRAVAQSDDTIRSPETLPFTPPEEFTP